MERKYAKQLGIKRSQFLEMFKNPLYIAKIHLKAYKSNPPRIVDAKHESILSSELFEKVQARINNEHRGKTFSIKKSEVGNFFYLKGLLFCAKSGKQMTAYQVNKQSGKQFYYYQATRAKGGQLINAIEAHQAISAALHALQINEDLYSSTKTILSHLIKEKQESDKKRASWLSGEIEKNQNRLVKLQDKYLDEEISKADYEELKQRCNANLMNYREELIIIRSNQESEAAFRMRVLHALKSIGDIFRFATIPNKKAMLRAIFPEGFAIQDGVVLTQRINTYIDAIVSKSMNYEALKIKTGHTFEVSPVVGGQSDKDITVKDRELLNLLFQAA